MNSTLIGILASLSTNAYTTSQKLGSQYLSPIYSMLISNTVVFVLGFLIFAYLKVSKQELLFNPKGIIFGILVGVFATGIEMLWVLAFSKNLSLISASVITGVVGAVFTVASSYFIFNEPVSWLKIISLLLALLSGFLLSIAH